jgi:hypothetical protein
MPDMVELFVAAPGRRDLGDLLRRAPAASSTGRLVVVLRTPLGR